jgi:5-methylcytosine-specific restriction enzyme A
VPKSRLPRELWRARRVEVWNRDHGQCVRCRCPVALRACHIDHIRSGKLGTNHLWNLRTLCRRCHALRADPRHRGMIAKALRDGVIPPNWRELVWEG